MTFYNNGQYAYILIDDGWYKFFKTSLGLDYIDYKSMLLRMKGRALKCLDKVLISIPRGAVCKWFLI